MADIFQEVATRVPWVADELQVFIATLTPVQAEKFAALLSETLAAWESGMRDDERLHEKLRDLGREIRLSEMTVQ